MDARLFSLLESMTADAYKTSLEIAKENNVNEKTIRTRMKELQQELDGNGATIISKQRWGYKLCIQEQEIFELWKKEVREKIKNAVPDSTEARIQYVLALLINRNDYIKIETLGEFLCVSNKTISMIIKAVENLLKEYDITIIRKPYYGIKLSGDEFSIRKCLMNFFMRQEMNELYDLKKQEEKTKEIGQMILDMIVENDLQFSDTSFENLVLYIYIMYKRMKRGRVVRVEEEKLEQVRETIEFKMAHRIVVEMVKAGMLQEYIESEVFYVSVYIACRRSGGSGNNISSNFIVPEKMMQLTDLMLNELFEVYQIDLRNDFDFRMMIANHMVPFSIRMQYGIPVKNPLLAEIRNKYPFIHAMAQRAMVPFTAFYENEISDDEIGYFTIYLMMALGNSQREIKKKNILLVCITGKASSNFLMYRLESEFKEYINQIQTCSIYELENYDFTDIDMVFSTVPIHRKVNVPIYVISDFLENSEILEARKNLEIGSLSFLKDYYRRELFFIDLVGRSSDEVIEELCLKTSAVIPLPESFLRSVKEREASGSTDYGNHVAIPHPQEKLVENSFVSVGILKKPITWKNNSVQMVILMSVFDSNNTSTQKFYEVTTRLLSNQQKIDEIIAAKSFDVLFQNLC